MLAQQERSLTAKQAVMVAKSFLAEKGFSLQVRSIGRELETIRVEIFDLKGISSVGSGKGIGEQALASALFEAIEHYVYTSIGGNGTSVPQKLLLHGSDHLLNKISPSFCSISGDQSLAFTRTKMREFLGKRSIFYPSFLLNPYFHPNLPKELSDIRKYRLSRYSTNSGTAAGTSFSEALLHGVLEVVERDAIGLLFLGGVFKQKPQPIRKLNKPTLPDETQNLLNEIERETGGKTSLIDITTDLKVPATLAHICVERGKFKGNYFGSGASLSAEYSFERAALEALQTFHIYSFGMVKRPPVWTLDKDNIPLLFRCHLEAGIFFPRANYTKVNFDKTPVSDLCKSDVSGQLKGLTKMLDHLGYPVFYKTLSDGPIWVVRCEVLGLEKFHLVSHGIPVLPNARGDQFLNTNH